MRVFRGLPGGLVAVVHSTAPHTCKVSVSRPHVPAAEGPHPHPPGLDSTSRGPRPAQVLGFPWHYSADPRPVTGVGPHNSKVSARAGSAKPRPAPEQELGARRTGAGPVSVTEPVCVGATHAGQAQGRRQPTRGASRGRAAEETHVFPPPHGDCRAPTCPSLENLLEAGRRGRSLAS